METNTDDILEKMCEETGEPPWFCPICEYYSYGYRAFARHLEGLEHAEEVKWMNPELPPDFDGFTPLSLPKSESPKSELPKSESPKSEPTQVWDWESEIDSMLREATIRRMQNLRPLDEAKLPGPSVISKKKNKRKARKA